MDSSDSDDLDVMLSAINMSHPYYRACDYMKGLDPGLYLLDDATLSRCVRRDEESYYTQNLQFWAILPQPARQKEYNSLYARIKNQAQKYGWMSQWEEAKAYLLTLLLFSIDLQLNPKRVIWNVFGEDNDPAIHDSVNLYLSWWKNPNGNEPWLENYTMAHHAVKKYYECRQNGWIFISGYSMGYTERIGYWASKEYKDIQPSIFGLGKDLDAKIVSKCDIRDIFRYCATSREKWLGMWAFLLLYPPKCHLRRGNKLMFIY